MLHSRHLSWGESGFVPLGLYPAPPTLILHRACCTFRWPDLTSQIIWLLLLEQMYLCWLSQLKAPSAELLFPPAWVLKSEKPEFRSQIYLLFSMWPCVSHFTLLWFNFPICKRGQWFLPWNEVVKNQGHGYHLQVKFFAQISCLMHPHTPSTSSFLWFLKCVLISVLAPT